MEPQNVAGWLKAVWCKINSWVCWLRCCRTRLDQGYSKAAVEVAAIAADSNGRKSSKHQWRCQLSPSRTPRYGIFTDLRRLSGVQQKARGSGYWRDICSLDFHTARWETKAKDSSEDTERWVSYFTFESLCVPKLMLFNNHFFLFRWTQCLRVGNYCPLEVPRGGI